MKKTGIATLDLAPEAAAEWLEELSRALDWPDNRRAYLLLRAVMHAVRDWLSADEAAQLAAQMPILIRGIFYDGWNPAAIKGHSRSGEDFLLRINAAFSKEPLDNTEKAVSAVFGLLEHRISGGEIEQVKATMRKEIRDLWP